MVLNGQSVLTTNHQDKNIANNEVGANENNETELTSN